MDVIWLNEPSDPALNQQLTGTFQSHSDWANYKLEIELSSEGVLKGHFAVGKQVLEVRGGIGKSGLAFGFLLDPIASVPVALFRIKQHQQQLSFEMDLPEFDTLLDYCQTETVCFERVTLDIGKDAA